MPGGPVLPPPLRRAILFCPSFLMWRFPHCSVWVEPNHLQLCAGSQKAVAICDTQNKRPTSVGGISPLTPESLVSIGADHSTDVAIHDEIKRRAYKLYEQRGAGDGHHLEDELQSELPRTLYAAAQLEKYIKGEVGDIN